MLIEWIAIALFVFIGLIFLQFEHHTRKYKIVALIIIGFLLYFSIVTIFSSEQVDLKSPRGIVNGIYLYFGWMGETGAKLWDIGTDTVALAGNAIKIDNQTEQEPRR